MPAVPLPGRLVPQAQALVSASRGQAAEVASASRRAVGRSALAEQYAGRARQCGAAAQAQHDRRKRLRSNITDTRSIGLPLRWGFMAGFVVVLGFSIAHHEMWRDEIQVWLIVRASESLPSLLRNMDYEGHPPLWYLVVWLLESLFSSIRVLQLANIVFAAITIWYLLRLERVPRAFRLLWPLTYMLFYEYGTLSRNYFIGIAFLMLALFCAFEHRRAMLAYVFLALAAFTNVYCAAIAGAVGASWLLLGASGVGQDEHTRKISDALGGRYFLMACLLATILIAGLVALPPADSAVKATLQFDWGRIEHIVAMFVRGAFLAPDVTALRWNGPHLFDVLGLGRSAQFWMSIGFMTIVAWLSRRSLALLGYWLMAAGGLVTVGLVTDRFFFWRHSGQAAVAFAVWYIMYCYLRPRGSERRPQTAALVAIITVFLATNSVATIPAVVADVERSFSYGGEAARYVRSHYDPRTTLLLGYEDSRVSAVHAFAPEFPFVYLNSGAAGGYARWGNKERKYTTLSQRHIVAVAEERGCVAPDARQRLLVSHINLYGAWGDRRTWITDEMTAMYAIKFVAGFAGSLSGDEDVYLYEMKCPPKHDVAAQRDIP